MKSSQSGVGGTVSALSPLPGQSSASTARPCARNASLQRRVSSLLVDVPLSMTTSGAGSAASSRAGPGSRGDASFAMGRRPGARPAAAPAASGRTAMMPRRAGRGSCAGRRRPASRPDGRQAPRAVGRAPPRAAWPVALELRDSPKKPLRRPRPAQIPVGDRPHLAQGVRGDIGGKTHRREPPRVDSDRQRAGAKQAEERRRCGARRPTAPAARPAAWRGE